jgi:hypothetical protein
LTTDELIVPEARAWTKSSRVPLVAVRPPAVSRPELAEPPSVDAAWKRMPPLSRFTRSDGLVKESVAPLTVRLLATVVPEVKVAAPSRAFEPLAMAPTEVA